MSWRWWLGLGISVVAALFVVGAIVYILFLIVVGFWASRRGKSNQMTRLVPGLGELRSTDGRDWSCQMDGISLSIQTVSGHPSSTEVENVRALVGNLPRLVDLARGFIEREDFSEYLDPKGPGEFDLFGLSVRSAGEFMIELQHAADPDGWYYVVFENGEPSWAGRDD